MARSAAEAYTASYAMPSLAANTPVLLDAEYVDTDSYHSTATDTERIVFPCAGLYLLTGHLLWAATGSATDLRYQYFVAPAANKGPGLVGWSYAASTPVSAGGVTMPIFMRACPDDYVFLAGNGTGGSAGTAKAQVSVERIDYSTDVCVATGSAMAMNAILSFAVDAYDPGGLHSTVSNTSRITVSSTGYWMIGFAGALASRPLSVPGSVEFYVNGSPVTANGWTGADMNVNIGDRGIASMVLMSLTSGDYVEVYGTAGGGSGNMNNGAFFAFPIGSVNAASVYHSADVAIGAGWSTLAFDSETLDTSSFHDNSTNNSRLTAPADGYYAVWATAFLSNAAANQTGLRVAKNGTAIGTNVLKYDASNWGGGMVYEIVYLDAGQYVEIQAYQSTTVKAGVSAGIRQVHDTDCGGSWSCTGFVPQIIRRR